jgi:hypothetical protein
VLIGLCSDCESVSELGQGSDTSFTHNPAQANKERRLHIMAKVKVNHNGACEGYTYEADKPFEVRGDDLSKLQAALGDELTVLEKETKKEEAVEEKKDAKPEHNKMVGNDQKHEKVVTK